MLSFPPGVVNTVPSLGGVGGAALAAHPNVDKGSASALKGCLCTLFIRNLVAFTGSTVTGRKIMEAAAKSNLKKACSMETSDNVITYDRFGYFRCLWNWEASPLTSFSNQQTSTKACFHSIC